MKGHLNNLPESQNNFSTDARKLILLARQYYELGLAPIPCAPRSKKPACKWERWQNHRPDWSELELVWHEAIQRFGQNLNIATILGEAHGLCAIDVDEPEKFRLARQQVGLTENDLQTWVTKSHRGGALIFRYPQGVKIPSKVSNQNWGAELLGNERILMLPPSIHPSGTRYQWVFAPHKVALSEIPPTLLEVFGISKKFDAQNVKSETYNDNGELPQWAWDLISLLRPYWFEGQRHDLALALSGVLARRGVDRSLAEKILSTLVNEQGDPELRDRIRALLDTYDRLAENESVLAWSGLEKTLDESTLRAIDSLLPRNGSSTVVVVSEPIQRPQNPCTDLGNAERLVRLFGNHIKFVPQLGWLVWDGKRWLRDIGNQMVTKMAEEVVRSIYAEAAQAVNPEERTRLAKWAMASENRQRIMAMVELAAPMCRADFSDFDNDPYLLNCLNGVVDLRTGKLLPHNPDLNLTKLCPVDYDCDATAPTWQKFLTDVFLGDHELIAYIQRALGYSITGDVCEDTLFICYGSGSNGKTTFLSVVLEVLGDYGKVIAPDALLKRNQQADSHPTVIADLFGCRLAVAQEVEEGRHLATARVKALTGRDRVKARYMRRDYFEFSPTHKIWLATNHKPIITDTTFAIWRRIQLVTFRAVFDADRRDKRMLQKLLAEKEGILTWLVQGCLQWQQHGLNPPKVVQEATREYQSEMDKVQTWLEDCCVVDPKAVTPFSDLFVSYTEWCKNNEEEPIGKRSFSNRLTEKGFSSVTLPGGVKARKGLRLKDMQPSKPPEPPKPPEPRESLEPAEVTHEGVCFCADVPKNEHFAANIATHEENVQSSAQEHKSTKLGTTLEPQPDTFVETEAWLANEVGFADVTPSTDHRPNTDSHPPSGDKPPPTPQPSANPPPKPLKSYKNLSSPKELRPEELESEERFACPNCGNWRRVPVSTVMLVGPPRCPVCGSTMNPAQEPPPIVGGDRK
ncbi:phage/plasmid primase, P4 family, C-terminal domain-containing protein [Candidatus Fervidibacteria bacterium JGI MDM2 JNZ-1-D12]